MTYTFKHVPMNDPLSREGGPLEQKSYRKGLLLTDAPVVKDSTGEWLIGPFETPEGAGAYTRRCYANVHPLYADEYRSLRHDGLRVFGIRFFVDSCEECGTFDDYGNRWRQMHVCNGCQLDMDLDAAQAAEIAFQNRGDM